MNQNKQKAIEVLKEMDDYIDALSFEEIEGLIDALDHLFIDAIGDYSVARTHYWTNLMAIYRKLYVDWDSTLECFPALIEAVFIEEVDAINIIHNKILKSRDKRIKELNTKTN